MSIANLRSLANPRVPISELNLNMLLGGPILALPCQEGAGATVYDISGFGNDGAFRGAGEPAWAQLASGLWTLSFDGSNDYVSTPAITTPTELTIMFWIIFNSFPASQYENIIGNRDTGNDGDFMIYRVQDALKLRPTIYTAPSGYSSHDSDAIVIDTPYHIAMTWKRPNLRSYINGVEDTASPTVIDEPSTSATRLWRIGLDEYNKPPPDALISLIGACPRALSDTEVLNHCNREKHLLGILDGNILARLANLRS